MVVVALGLPEATLAAMLMMTLLMLMLMMKTTKKKRKRKKMTRMMTRKGRMMMPWLFSVVVVVGVPDTAHEPLAMIRGCVRLVVFVVVLVVMMKE